MNYNKGMKQIGRALKRARLAREATQAQVAKALGCSQEVLSMIEDGVRTPGDKLLGKISDWLTSGSTPGKSKRGPYNKA